MAIDPANKVKDSDAVLDFAFDWSLWLGNAETISSYVITASPGITVNSDTSTSTAVTAWLSGGVAPQPYTLACRITTNQGRTDERTMTIRVINR